MSKLAPNLFERRFQDLMEIGRARLPSLAPEWTDHNAHDPGITLMELVAWVAEAQLYSLSRTRRDERTAYAAMLGLEPTGTRAASGLLWSDRSDPNSPSATFQAGTVIAKDAAINVLGDEVPTFRPSAALLWSPGRIEKLETRFPNRQIIDHTITNERGGLPFRPFGEGTGRRAVLKLTFVCSDPLGLLGKDREAAKGALWSIGVRAAASIGTPIDPSVPVDTPRTSLRITLVADDERFEIPVVSDTTHGFLNTGAILLNLESVTAAPDKLKIVTLEFRSPQGFARPPQILRLEPNVIPVVQGRTVEGELHEAPNEIPDWSFKLNVPGLRFDREQDPLKVQVGELGGTKTWNRKRLSDCGPDDDAYEFDIEAGEVRFGNGVNGRIPPAGAQVIASYDVSEGEEGNVARNRKWKVTGIAGTFGVNPDPVIGGAGRSGWIDDRREARKRSREDHALVSSDDIVTAATKLPLFEVARAWVIEPDASSPRTGVVTLVVLRNRAGGAEPDKPPETARWLEAIRRGLIARMPLATRLNVVAPRYVEFRISAVLEAEPNRDPSEIKKKVEEELRTRLSLVETSTGVPPRQPGVPITSRDLVAWMRSVDGVSRVTQLQLEGGDGKIADNEITVPPHGLARWNSGQGGIDVRRRANGGSR